MGTNIPTNIPEFINWCNAHSALWTTNAAAVGLTPAQATAFATLVTGLGKANTDAENGREASKNLTLALQNNLDATHGLASIYVSTIKNFAESTHNMNVYALGGVSPNSPPGTVPTPVAPAQFSAGVNPDGSLTIKWKVSQPAGVSGVSYLISRRVNGGDGPFTFVGSEGSNKSFMDDGLPVGVDRVEYIVQPKRGMDLGPQSNVFAVQFGSVSGGNMGGLSISTIASTPHAEPMKIAA